jgi:hypothetical protein
MTPDYAVYVKRINDFQQSIATKGEVLVKVQIKPAHLLAWCKNQGREVDASGRAAYAASRDLTLQN